MNGSLQCKTEDWPSRLARMAREYEEREYEDDPEGLLGKPSTRFMDLARACKRARSIMALQSLSMQPEMERIKSAIDQLQLGLAVIEKVIRLETAATLRNVSKRNVWDPGLSNEAAMEIAAILEAGDGGHSNDCQRGLRGLGR